ncbi:hypothetical protein [Patulibacter sp. SYSU D01012]|uniref:DUF6531 domain-containing protein n=1 Tax=Patulibacter sp. SYSU D01012 TaxID=2817381 RepID=UPI001B30F191|nr:hypothetical protein [Patulibacter sp. SYSU D01012]
MTSSQGQLCVCSNPTPSVSRSRLGRTTVLAGIAVGLALTGAGAAQAASNPGTGDTGFFTFRPSSATGGTQVNVASGNGLVRTRDLADSDGNFHVVVDRAYNSLASEAFSILGPRWAFDVGPATRLAVQGNGDALVTGPSGYRLLFVEQPDGSLKAPAGFDGSLVKTSSGWTLSRTSLGDQFGFDGSGQLSWTKDSQAHDFTVQGTSAAGRDVLSSYGTSSGRRVNLSYAGDSLVREMDDPSAGHHYYGYTNGKLTSYRSPSGAETAYRYASNGFLDKITEAGGTTVELDTTAGGKVKSITTTLPGAVGQTTRFVYTRRPYKTDVTAPDGVRRTYAYDDDYRVTRQYDPDVEPSVTAAGELRDLADGYVGPNRTYPLTISASGPGGSGLRRLAVARENGADIAGQDVPCVASPFDTVCPTEYSVTPNASFASVPEGPQVLRAYATDDEDHRGVADPWTVLVDRTAPMGPSQYEIRDFDPNDGGGSANIAWTPGSDPTLPDGTPGSGASSSQTRFGVNGAAPGPWTDGSADHLTVHGVHQGDVVSVEARSVDAVGNVSPVTSASLTLAEAVADGVPDRGDVGSQDDSTVVVEHDRSTEVPEGQDQADLPDEPVTLTPVPDLNARAGSVRRRWTIATAGGWVTARNDVQQLYIGAGKNGWTFDSVKSSKSAPSDPALGLYGYLYGKYKYCAWINSEALGDSEPSPTDHCRSFDHIPVRDFAAIVNCDQCNGGTSVRLNRAVSGYRNVRPWIRGPKVASSEAVTYKAGDRVNWRYVTPDNKWVAVSDRSIPSAANWVFIARDAFGYASQGADAMCKNGRGSRRPAKRHTNWPAVCSIH